ncbi:hypothetical protein EVAR_96695_1 [Eumeta japonica]|uniref:Uncharacterized protein n=1 Tax=Eumeta variegata TaxID=151549 RepID=A0A4C1WJE9_EUMVA|nr:hypothetical protein EVAR_96695_1 [Eumeta japonica]
MTHSALKRGHSHAAPTAPAAPRQVLRKPVSYSLLSEGYDRGLEGSRSGLRRGATINQDGRKLLGVARDGGGGRAGGRGAGGGGTRADLIKSCIELARPGRAAGRLTNSHCI